MAEAATPAAVETEPLPSIDVPGAPDVTEAALLGQPGPLEVPSPAALEPAAGEAAAPIPLTQVVEPGEIAAVAVEPVAAPASGQIVARPEAAPREARADRERKGREQGRGGERGATAAATAAAIGTGAGAATATGATRSGAPASRRTSRTCSRKGRR